MKLYDMSTWPSELLLTLAVIALMTGLFMAAWHYEKPHRREKE